MPNSDIILKRMLSVDWIYRWANAARLFVFVRLLKRVASISDLREGKWTRLDKLPEEFSWREYLELNPDLVAAGITTRLAAIEHYLLSGRLENRSYINTLRGPLGEAIGRLSAGQKEGQDSLGYVDILSARTLSEFKKVLGVSQIKERHVRRFFRSQLGSPLGLGDGEQTEAEIHTDLAAAAFAFGHLKKALTAVERALEMNPGNEHALQLKFEILIRQNRFDAASELVDGLLDCGYDNADAWVRFVRLAIDANSAEEGFAALKRAIKQLPGQSVLARALIDLSAVHWRNQSVEAEKRLRAGDRQGFIALCEAATSLFITNVESLYAPPHGRALRDGSVLLIVDDHVPQCLHYRVEQKLDQLGFLARKCESVPWRDFSSARSRIPFFETIVFYRVPGIPEILEMMLYARHLGKNLFYEIDDFLFDEAHYPQPLETYGGAVDQSEYMGLQRGATYFRTAMALFEHFIVSTEPLGDQVKRVFGPDVTVHVHRNGLDEIISGVAKKPLPVLRDTVRIFYGTGTKAHNEDFERLAAPALLALLQRHPNLEFVCVGQLNLPAGFDDLQDQVRIVPLVKDLVAYYSLLASCDISIAPLVVDTVNNCKSELKWFEAGILGVPSVLSPTQNYLDVVPDGTALFATDADEWERQLERLVVDRGLRASTAEKCLDLVMQQYSLEAGAGNLDQIFPLADSSGPSQLRKQKVMYVNVFYAPQNIGGATRIVESNIAVLREQYGDEFEITVFTSDAHIHADYEVEEYAVGGVRVVKVLLPLVEFFEWNYQDENVKEIFTEFLLQEAPDLVHFHCVQRLTASVVGAALDLGFPYFITGHDAWWLSDHQFLMDDRDMPCPLEQADPLISGHRSGIRLEDSIRRKRYLAQMLENALNVILVSRAFEKLYRLNGVANATTCENGISAQYASLQRSRKRQSGRTVIGHVGGMSAHKGYQLIMSVLEEHGFPNLEFLFVDHARGASFRTDASNDLNRITIVGRVSQERIHELYDRIDVLAAPSLWPESYGLVTREALSYGLWAIASNRGAIGEDVVEGENGFVVDVADRSDLTRTLESIDSNHLKYQASPQMTFQPRTIDDQVREVVNMYRAVDSSSGLGPLRFIIGGFEHSGTTMLSEIFRQVPGLDSGFEGGFLLTRSPQRFVGFEPFYGQFANGWGLEQEDLERICRKRKWSAAYHELLRSATALAEGTAALFDKTPRYFQKIDTILNEYPNLRAILLVRDFRSLMYSTFRRSGMEIGEWMERAYPDSVRFMNTYLDAYKRLEASPAIERAHVVRYEELCFNPEKVCAEVFDFVGFQFEERYLHFDNPKFDNVYGASVDPEYVFRFVDTFDEEIQARIREDFKSRAEWFWDIPGALEV